MALSLFEFRVNITLLTDGGQSVTLYTVSVWMCVDVGTSVMYVAHSVYTDMYWNVACTNYHRLRSEE